MPYTVRQTCLRCGRAYTYPSDWPVGTKDCPLCWREPDLTEVEAAIENDKDDS